MFSQRKHIALLSVSLMLMFAGAFTTRALCDLEIIDYAANLTHQHEDAGHNHAQNHPEDNPGDHHDTHGTAHHDDHAGSGHQHGADDEACCAEIASDLTTGLFFSQPATYTPAVKYFLLRTIELNLKSILTYQQINITYYEYVDPPPLEGYRLRVLIQSFLN